MPTDFTHFTIYTRTIYSSTYCTTTIPIGILHRPGIRFRLRDAIYTTAFIFIKQTTTPSQINRGSKKELALESHWEKSRAPVMLYTGADKRYGSKLSSFIAHGCIWCRSGLYWHVPDCRSKWWFLRSVRFVLNFRLHLLYSPQALQNWSQSCRGWPTSCYVPDCRSKRANLARI